MIAIVCLSIGNVAVCSRCVLVIRRYPIRCVFIKGTVKAVTTSHMNNYYNRGTYITSEIVLLPCGHLAI